MALPLPRAGRPADVSKGPFQEDVRTVEKAGFRFPSDKRRAERGGDSNPSVVTGGDFPVQQGIYREISGL